MGLKADTFGRPLWKRHRRLGNRGQAVVEVAVALPILLALLIGIFEFASAYRVQQVITNAAREGARVGVLPTSGDPEVQTQVDNYLSAGGISSATTTISGTGGATGSPVTVTVNVNYRFVFLGPVLRLFTIGCMTCDPGTVSLSSTSTMRKE